ncbi:restriction endonuclease [Microbulbifer sp. SSSA007]|uniref:restriction endonuclease n=1 Tax=Microbulbifer sp. SSSA007 TaxID=3243379 RepID=UPI00403A4592
MSNREFYEIEVVHNGLGKYRHIRGTDRYVVEQKAAAQKATWDEMWRKKKKAEQKRKEKEDAIRSKEQKIALAQEKTDEAVESLERLEKTLLHTLTIDDSIDWDSLLDKAPYPERKPKKPSIRSLPVRPTRDMAKYNPKMTLLEKIIPLLKDKYLKRNDEVYGSDYSNWEAEVEKVNFINTKCSDKYSSDLKTWEEKKVAYEIEQQSRNQEIKKQKGLYFSSNSDALIDYCEMVLSNSEYPEYFPREWSLDYIDPSRMLIVDYSLPDIGLLPTLKSVKYVSSRDEFTESYISQSALNKLYDSLLYQVALRTIHELYEADQIKSIDSIVFNGWVNSIDKATGQEVNACILSLQASKDEFLAINLERVDSKACFKQLKGVGSSKLHGLSPIAPIVTIDTNDKRFTSSYEVADSLEDGDNLAAMDWQDFENLIREIFEKEFASGGGEVKITQASRDGGVDAVAFDPDPIRGGKIVIQAKRYTNSVGVSAVRDLYGTTVNEGATKGILVTTADFGPDAYEFVKGKPLTLLNGSNLLHLLQKHGHKARIDLQEAKLALSEVKS